MNDELAFVNHASNFSSKFLREVVLSRSKDIVRYEINDFMLYSSRTVIIMEFPLSAFDTIVFCQ